MLGAPFVSSESVTNGSGRWDSAQAGAVKQPGVPGRVEIRVGAMQKATIIPHQNLSGAPVMMVDEAFLCGVRLKRFDPRPSFFHRKAFKVGCVRAHKQGGATGVRMDARQGMAVWRRVVNFRLAHRSFSVFAGQFPTVNDLDAREVPLFILAQGFVGGVHVGEAGITAIGR